MMKGIERQRDQLRTDLVMKKWTHPIKINNKLSDVNKTQMFVHMQILVIHSLFSPCILHS